MLESNKLQNHSKLLAQKTSAQSQMINIKDINEVVGRADLNHSHIATSDNNVGGLSNLHS